MGSLPPLILRYALCEITSKPGERSPGFSFGALFCGNFFHQGERIELRAWLFCLGGTERPSPGIANA
jgi:hypothetical protein